MTQSEKINAVLLAVSCSIGDRYGCNDSDKVRAKRWQKAFNSKNKEEFQQLVEDIEEEVG